MKQKFSFFTFRWCLIVFSLLAVIFSIFDGRNISTAKAQGQANFVDPLFGYYLTMGPEWNVSSPNVTALTKSRILSGVTIIDNFDPNRAEAQGMQSGDLKIQLSVGPMTRSDFLSWIKDRIWQETSSPDFAVFKNRSSDPERISLGSFKGYMFTITSSEDNSSVLEIDLLVKKDVVMSIGISPSNSPSIPKALAMLSTLDLTKTQLSAENFSEVPKARMIIADLLRPQSSSRDSNVQAVIHPPGWGSEAPDSPITLFMPFHDGETWQVGGGGNFYGDGDHSNSWNDYYATDWNRTAGDDLGKDVLPVSGGNVIQRRIAPCPTTGFGCYIKIDHGSGITTLYGHLSTVSRDLGGVNHWDVIGQVGSSGNSTGAHLHLQFRQNGFSTCRNNGNACPNGETSAAQQSPKPSPMNTQQGSVQLNDSSTYTSNNKESTPPPNCPNLSGVVRLYDLTNCQGQFAEISGLGLWSLESAFNDRAESIAVPSGWSARLYLHNSETSPSACFSSNNTDLNDDFFTDGTKVANQATWIRVYSNSSCSGGNPPDAPLLSSPANGQSFIEGESINLSWSATGSEYYGEISGGPGNTLTFGWQPGTSKNIGSQWAGYVYTWKVKARNNYGESGWSSSWSFFVRPGAPTNLNASAVSCRQINLSWGDNSSNEEGYRVYRNGNLVTTLGSGATSYPDGGLSANTGYSYVVRAYRGNIESNDSNTASATTSTCPAGTPSLISPADGQFFNEGEPIILSWSATGSEYYGEIWGGPGGTLSFGWQPGTSINIGPQWAGYVYFWHVKARNGLNESGWSNTRTFIVRPGIPGNLSASAVSCSQINLSWSDNSGNEEGYKVYRNGSVVVALGSGVTSYPDTGLAGNITYQYVVKAYRGNIESNASNTSSATTNPCPTIPSPPGDIGATDGDYADRVWVLWLSSSGATRYELWRNTSNVINGAIQIANNVTGSGAVIEYNDTSATPGVVYFYWAKACNSAGCSGFSKSDSGYRANFSLTVNKTGSGSGAVTSNPFGIDCGSDCSQNYANNATITLTAAADDGSVFTGWSGAGCFGTGQCLVNMNASKTVTANFAPACVAINTFVDPEASGFVGVNQITDGIIDPPPTCRDDNQYPYGAIIRLTAYPESGYLLDHWSGDLSGSDNPMDITMTSDKYVTAHFIFASPNTNVYIGGIWQGGYYVPPQGSVRQRYIGVNDGPVQIIGADKIMGAERVIYRVNGVNTSFTEMMGMPENQLDTTYWLPWYNNVDLDTQLRFGNVDVSTATVRVYIGGQEMSGSPFTLAPGASTRRSFPGVNSGPVKIVSNVNIVAAERVIYKVNGVNTSFSEMMGLPNSQLNTTYWLPWYNNVDMDTQLRFGNVSNSTAMVRVYIGGQEMAGSPFTLTPGASTRASFPGIKNGPVKIVSNVNIVAAERVIYKANGIPTSFTEMMALPNSQSNTAHWLPWYNNAALNTQLRISNTSTSTATVHVYIGGSEMTGSPFNLAPNTSVARSYAGIDSGPVEIVSSQNIFVSEPIIYRVNNVNTSFTEMMGLPNHLLDTAYWLPWYNNVDLDTQLRFGRP